jgi:DNA-binding Xre family transcriptional regulator
MATAFRLREILEDLGIHPNISELARVSGVSRVTLHRMFHNLSTRVDLATLDALASTLGCEPGELVGKNREKVQ